MMSVLDEPVRGVDVGSIVEIHRIINDLADTGIGACAALIVGHRGLQCLQDRSRSVGYWRIPDEPVRGWRVCFRS